MPQKPVKAFLAGRVHGSAHTKPYWREELLWHVNTNTPTNLVNTNDIRETEELLDRLQLDISAISAHSAFYIAQSDMVVVNLSDDISVGGSQEILFAKYFGKKVIGLAPRGGKFNRLIYNLGGHEYWNWLHPFVASLCDVVVHDTNELADVLQRHTSIPGGHLAAVQDHIRYYLKTMAADDAIINSLLATTTNEGWQTKKPLKTYFAGKMETVPGVDTANWREYLASYITGHSPYRCINLDFLEPNLEPLDEADSRLVFGRDSYLIRSADVVVVNLSDDISVGGSAEMLIAKLFNRPLIGIAPYGGKFNAPDKEINGKIIRDFINPFVSLTCDYIVHDYKELPAAFSHIAQDMVKTIHVIHYAREYYRKAILPHDRFATTLFAA